MISMFKVLYYCQLMYFGKFRNMCVEIYELDSARFFTVRGLP